MQRGPHLCEDLRPNFFSIFFRVLNKINGAKVVCNSATAFKNNGWLTIPSGRVSYNLEIFIILNFWVLF
jgi:hypothetical protein